MEFNNKRMTPEIQEWIAQQDAMSRQEATAHAIEAQTEAIEAQTEAMQAYTSALLASTKANERLAASNEDLASEISTLNERLAPCDFTQWRISECLSNLVMSEQNKRGE